MDLGAYLGELGESQASFAGRADLTQRTVSRVVRREVRSRGDVLEKIIRACRERPAPSGRVVTWEDLVPLEDELPARASGGAV